MDRGVGMSLRRGDSSPLIGALSFVGDTFAATALPLMADQLLGLIFGFGGSGGGAPNALCPLVVIYSPFS